MTFIITSITIVTAIITKSDILILIVPILRVIRITIVGFIRKPSIRLIDPTATSQVEASQPRDLFDSGTEASVVLPTDDGAPALRRLLAKGPGVSYTGVVPVRNEQAATGRKERPPQAVEMNSLKMKTAASPSAAGGVRALQRGSGHLWSPSAGTDKDARLLIHFRVQNLLHVRTPSLVDLLERVVSALASALHAICDQGALRWLATEGDSAMAVTCCYLQLRAAGKVSKAAGTNLSGARPLMPPKKALCVPCFSYVFDALQDCLLDSRVAENAHAGFELSRPLQSPGVWSAYCNYVVHRYGFLEVVSSVLQSWAAALKASIDVGNRDRMYQHGIPDEVKGLATCMVQLLFQQFKDLLQGDHEPERLNAWHHSFEVARATLSGRLPVPVTAREKLHLLAFFSDLLPFLLDQTGSWNRELWLHGLVLRTKVGLEISGFEKAVGLVLDVLDDSGPFAATLSPAMGASALEAVLVLVRQPPEERQKLLQSFSIR
ncbi:unnamed protein product, partial [Symbiodinium sp. KB8]